MNPDKKEGGSAGSLNGRSVLSPGLIHQWWLHAPATNHLMLSCYLPVVPAMTGGVPFVHGAGIAATREPVVPGANVPGILVFNGTDVLPVT
jgi:hypothetical protein